MFIVIGDGSNNQSTTDSPIAKWHIYLRTRIQLPLFTYHGLAHLASYKQNCVTWQLASGHVLEPVPEVAADPRRSGPTQLIIAVQARHLAKLPATFGPRYDFSGRPSAESHQWSQGSHTSGVSGVTLQSPIHIRQSVLKRIQHLHNGRLFITYQAKYPEHQHISILPLPLSHLEICMIWVATG